MEGRDNDTVLVRLLNVVERKTYEGLQGPSEEVMGALEIIGLIAIAWAIGFGMGARNADGYWANHVNGGSVYHKGKFYVVKPEGND